MFRYLVAPFCLLTQPPQTPTYVYFGEHTPLCRPVRPTVCPSFSDHPFRHSVRPRAGFPGTSFKPLTRTPCGRHSVRPRSGGPWHERLAPNPHPLASLLSLAHERSVVFGGGAPVCRFGFFATQRLVWEPLTLNRGARRPHPVHFSLLLARCGRLNRSLRLCGAVQRGGMGRGGWRPPLTVAIQCNSEWRCLCGCAMR